MLPGESRHFALNKRESWERFSNPRYGGVMAVYQTVPDRPEDNINHLLNVYNLLKQLPNY